MSTIVIEPTTDGVEAQIAGIKDYLQQAQARQLVADLQSQGASQSKIVRKLRLAKNLFGW